MPFDNIKTRMQSLGSTKSVSMYRLALSMLKTEGPLVFWRATTPRLLRLTVGEKDPFLHRRQTNHYFKMSSAITFTVFNQIVAFAAHCKEQPWNTRIKDYL